MKLKALTAAPAPWTYFEKEGIIGDASGMIVAKMPIWSKIDGELIASAPGLAEKVRALEIQVGDASTCIQDLRDLLAEQDPVERSRSFIVGATARLKAYDDRYSGKKKTGGRS